MGKNGLQLFLLSEFFDLRSSPVLEVSHVAPQGTGRHRHFIFGGGIMRMNFLFSSKSWNNVERVKFKQSVVQRLFQKWDKCCCSPRSHGPSLLCWESYQQSNSSNIWKMSLHDYSASKKRWLNILVLLTSSESIRLFAGLWESKILNYISGWPVAKSQLPGNSARRSQTSVSEIPFLRLSH